MRSASNLAVVLVTAPNLKVARSLARIALEARIVACVNIMPRIESHYWWRGKLCSGKECLMVLKTSRSRLKELERLIVRHHPYDTPEFITLPLSSGNAKYLAWLTGELVSKGA
jgi:periplasmic divalent cation tolerance protein